MLRQRLPCEGESHVEYCKSIVLLGRTHDILFHYSLMGVQMSQILYCLLCMSEMSVRTWSYFWSFQNWSLWKEKQMMMVSFFWITVSP